ncbi:MAG: argininosuccinate lyase [Actinomycetota bacterium]|jgi:argininosuccinate lyase
MTEARDALWGGRFANGPADAMAALSKSTHFDWRLARYDLLGSAAHVKALAQAGVVTEEEREVLLRAIEELAKRIDQGMFSFRAEDEDVHSALERGLIEIAGNEAGGKVRAGRSRNDQIATLIRMYALDASRAIEDQLLSYLDALCSKAEEYMGVAMAGRTHFQHAQPILLSHHLLAHAWPQVRNLQRLEDLRKRLKKSPYGSAALAGNTFGLDAQMVAGELGFTEPTENSIDATAARDLVAEFTFVLAMIAVDLSRLAEEIVIWSTAEFDYVKLSDQFSTGSSIMPQKKNPDVAELARGKSGRVIGNLAGLLSTLKALPLGYNRDLQEDKEAVFDSLDTLMLVLPAFTGLIATLEFNRSRLQDLSIAGFSMATDVADYLVRQGVPFKDAHEVVGKLVVFCEENGLELDELSREQYESISRHLKPELKEVLNLSAAIESRNSAGGTSSKQVIEQLVKLRKLTGKGKR